MIPSTEDKLTIWKNLIEEKNKSGLMLKDFCKEKNITLSQFYYYHAIINRPNRKSNPLKKTMPALKPINLVQSNAKDPGIIRVIFPTGLQCELPKNMLPQEIKTILEVVKTC